MTTKQQIDNHIKEIWLAHLDAERLSLENFKDKKLREKYSKLGSGLFDSLEKYEAEQGLVWDYFKSLDVYKNNWDELNRIYKKTNELKMEEEEAKCADPRPNNYEVVDEQFEITGNIIITDPCYIREFISTSHNRDTLYGDWGCCVWEMEPDSKKIIDRKHPIGRFCADSGMVCVTDISKNGLKSENSIRDWMNRHPGAGTILDNFSGTIEYIVDHYFYASEGKWKEVLSLIIRGMGKKDGKNFAFATDQTSL